MSLSCSTVVFQFPSKCNTYPPFRFLSILLCVVSQDSILASSFCCCCCCLFQGLVVWPKLVDPFVSRNPWRFGGSHSPGWIMGCAYTIRWHGQIFTFSFPCLTNVFSCAMSLVRRLKRLLSCFLPICDFWLFSFYWSSLLGITHPFPHNELVHLPYIAVATNTRAN